MKKTSFFKRFLNGVGIWLASDLACLIVTMLGLRFFEYFFLKLLTALLCIVILALLFFNFGFKYGQQDRKLEKRGHTRDVYVSRKLGLLIALIPLICLGLLLLSRYEVIGNFLPIYQLTNAYFMPVVQMFVEGAHISGLSGYAYPVLFVLIAAIPVAVYFGYDFGYRDVDISFKIFYAKKS